MVEVARVGGTIARRDGFPKSRASRFLEKHMQSQIRTSILAPLLLALTAGLAVAHAPPSSVTQGSVIKVAQQTTTPPRISKTEGCTDRQQLTQRARCERVLPSWPERNLVGVVPSIARGAVNCFTLAGQSTGLTSTEHRQV